MTEEIAEHAIEKIVTRSPKSTTKFIWHGGEPLLLGTDFYKHILQVQKPLRTKGVRISNVAQSNGTLITEEWAKFFKGNNFGVGLSIDGPKEVNDRTRVFSQDNGAFEAIQKGARILDEHDVNYGYLAVVSRHNVDSIDAIINFMQEQKKRFKLVAVAPIGRAAKAVDDIMIEGNSFSDSQIRLFNRWMDEGDIYARSALWKYLVPVLTGSPIECIFYQDCQQSFIGVDSNGDVYPCGRFCGGNELRYGNLVKESFEDIWNHPARLALTKRSENLPDKCQKNCDYISIYNGGCPLQGSLSEEDGDINSADYNCGQYKRIFQAMHDRVCKEAGVE
tara:strand:- start:1216 stop:2217 length:1002 start_codon:yes stop_codon:yes gene_type:complete